MTATSRLAATTVRTAAALLVALAVTLGLPGPASAHAYLVRTDPADGAVLERAPDRLALYFSEHVVLGATRIELVDWGGRVTALSGLALETDAPDDTEGPSVVTAELPDLARGAYRVRWSTLSSDDLHRTSGYFVFGIRTAVTAAGFDEPRPRVSESGLKWVVLLGFGAALGSALVTRLLGGASSGRIVGRLRLLGRSGAAVAALGSALLLVDQAVAAGLGAHQLVASGYAGRWGVREAGLVLLFFALGRRPGTRARSVLLPAGALLAALGGALLGHAGADPGAAYTRVAVTAVHLLALLTWVGGVAALALVVLPAATGRPTDLGVRALMRRFATPAVALLGVGVASGVYLASATVVSVDAALATTYGRTLLVKLGLLGVMCLLALLNHRRLHGPHDLDLPVRGVRAEATAALLLLAATAVLTSAQPATEPGFRPQPQATPGPVAGRADDLQVGVDVSPGVAGLNVVSVTAFDTRRPSPGQVTGVVIDLGDGAVVHATAHGDGRWSISGVDLPAGTRQLEVTVTRPGLPHASFRTQWIVGSGTAGLAPTVSVAPLEGVLRTLALGLAALVAAGLVLGRRARARRSAGVRDDELSLATPAPPAPSDGRRRRSEAVH
jgi:copper transport protein